MRKEVSMFCQTKYECANKVDSSYGVLAGNSIYTWELAFLLAFALAILHTCDFTASVKLENSYRTSPLILNQI